MQLVEIRVQGHIDKDWSNWFEGFSITHLDGDQTLLSGNVRDQAAIYGLIAKLRDLGARLISVNYGGGSPLSISE